MTHPVYLVDDDEAVREALCLLLSTVGIAARGFADPGLFLAQIARLEPGCLILDIRMPVISGLKLQERLAGQGVDWPIIVISGHGDIDAISHRLAGFEERQRVIRKDLYDELDAKYATGENK